MILNKTKTYFIASVAFLFLSFSCKPTTKTEYQAFESEDPYSYDSASHTNSATKSTDVDSFSYPIIAQIDSPWLMVYEVSKSWPHTIRIRTNTNGQIIDQPFYSDVVHVDHLSLDTFRLLNSEILYLTTNSFERGSYRYGMTGGWGVERTSFDIWRLDSLKNIISICESERSYEIELELDEDDLPVDPPLVNNSCFYECKVTLDKNAGIILIDSISQEFKGYCGSIGNEAGRYQIKDGSVQPLPD